MTRLYFLIAAAAFVAVALANTEGPIVFEIDNDINKFRTGDLSTSIDLEPAEIDSAIFQYKLGTRKFGDRALHTNEYKSGKGLRPENYQTRMNYISTEFGTPDITYGEVTVEQSSGILNVYVTSGGFGQKQVSILVDAKNTTYLNAKAVFYGVCCSSPKK